MSALDDMFDEAENKRGTPATGGGTALDSMFDAAEEEEAGPSFMARPGDRIPGIPNVGDLEAQASQQIRVGEPRTPNEIMPAAPETPEAMPMRPTLAAPRREPAPPPKGFGENLSRALLPETTGGNYVETITPKGPLQGGSFMDVSPTNPMQYDTSMQQETSYLEPAATALGAGLGFISPIPGGAALGAAIGSGLTTRLGGAVVPSEKTRGLTPEGKMRTFLQAVQAPEAGLGLAAREGLTNEMKGEFEIVQNEDLPYWQRVQAATRLNSQALAFLGVAIIEDPADLLTAAGASRLGQKIKTAARDVAGQGMMDLGIGRVKSQVKSTIPEQRAGYKPETYFDYNLDQPGKKGILPGANHAQSLESADKQIKEAGAEMTRRIQEGADEGVRLDIPAEIDKIVAPILANPNASKEAQNLSGYIQKWADHYKAEARRLSPDGSGKLDLMAAQYFKQNRGEEGAWNGIARQRGLPVPKNESEQSDIAEMIYMHLNEAIDAAAPAGIQDLNRTISELIPMRRSLARQIIIDDRKNLFGINDVVSLAAALHNPLGGAALFAANKAAKSPRMASVLYRLGEKLKATKSNKEKDRILAVLRKLGISEEQIKAGALIQEEVGGEKVFRMPLGGADVRMGRGEGGGPAASTGQAPQAPMPPNAVPFRRPGEPPQQPRRKLGQEQEGAEDRPVGEDEPLLQDTNTPEFKAWFGDSKVVDEEGQPKVVYHGTTHDFDKFDKSSANVENFYGKGFYFTDSPGDVGRNYAGEGPDLTGRIERAVDILMDQGMSEKAARKRARRTIGGPHEGAVMPVHLSLKNPVEIKRGGGTYIEPSAKYNEELDEWEDDPESGGMRLYDAIRKVAFKMDDVDADKVWEDVSGSLSDGAFAYEIDQAMRRSEGSIYATDPSTGDNATGEFIRRVWKEMGYDGIIQHNANHQFPGMKLDPGTTHYITFESEQAKGIHNRGTWDPEDPHILRQEEGESPLAEGEADADIPFLPDPHEWNEKIQPNTIYKDEDGNFHVTADAPLGPNVQLGSERYATLEDARDALKKQGEEVAKSEKELPPVFASALLKKGSELLSKAGGKMLVKDLLQKLRGTETAPGSGKYTGGIAKKDELRWTSMEKALEERAEGIIRDPKAPARGSFGDKALQAEQYYKPGKEVIDPNTRAYVKVLDFQLERADDGTIRNIKVTVQDPPKKEYIEVTPEIKADLQKRSQALTEKINPIITRADAEPNGRDPYTRRMRQDLEEEYRPLVEEREKLFKDIYSGRTIKETIQEPRTLRTLPDEDDLKDYFRFNPEAAKTYRNQLKTNAAPPKLGPDGKPAKAKPAMITLKEFRDYLGEHGVEIKEHRRGFVPKHEQRKATKEIDRLKREHSKLIEERKKIILDDEVEGTAARLDAVDERRKAISDQITDIEERGGERASKWQDYTLEAHEGTAATDEEKQYGELILAWNKKSKTLEAMDVEEAKDFYHMHWGREGTRDNPIKNALGFIRYTTRHTPDGEKVLFIEELQSDWAQMIRDMGRVGQKPADVLEFNEKSEKLNGISNVPANDERRAAIKKEIEALKDSTKPEDIKKSKELDEKLNGIADTPENEKRRDNLEKELARIEDRVEDSDYTLQDAPFTGGTEDWTRLLLKRALRYAAENDFKHLSWATGEQQLRRYPLEAAIDKVEYEKLPDGKYKIKPMMNGRAVDIPQQYIDWDKPKTRGEIKRIIGHDLFNKIKESEYKTGSIGLDEIKNIGGEGHKVFYNEIMPILMKDLVEKKWKERAQPIELKVRKSGTGGPIDRDANQTPDGAYEIRSEEIDPEDNGYGDPGQWKIVNDDTGEVESRHDTIAEAEDPDNHPQIKDTESYSVEKIKPGDSGYEADLVYDTEKQDDGTWKITKDGDELPDTYATLHEADEAMKKLREENGVDQPEFYVTEDHGSGNSRFWSGPFESADEAENSNRWPMMNDTQNYTVKPDYGDPYTEWYIENSNGERVGHDSWRDDEYHDAEERAREEMWEHWKDEGGEEKWTAGDEKGGEAPAQEGDDPGFKRLAQQGVRINDKMREDLLKESQDLFQKKKGYIKGQIQRKRIGSVITLFKGRADATTWMHENGHWVRSEILRGDQDKAALKWTGQRIWNRRAEEKWARAWERYLYNGVAPSKELEGAFKTMKEAFRKTYGDAIGTEIGQDIPPEMKAVFDHVLLRGQRVRNAAKLKRLMAAMKRAGARSPRILGLIQKELQGSQEKKQRAETQQEMELAPQ